MLTQRSVDHYASGMKIDTLVAERDVVLTYVLKILDEGGLLEKLAFKGGTCLKKIYYSKTTRFSEDLDFTSIDPNSGAFTSKLEAAFDNKEHYDITFRIKDQNLKKEGTVAAYRAVMEYEHEWNKGTFTLDISYREKPVLPVTPHPMQDELYFSDLEFASFNVPSLEKEELMSEKIRAAFQRLRPRDVYDLYRYSQGSYDKGLVKTLAVIKCWNVKEQLVPETLLEKIQEGRHSWDEDLKRLVRPGQLPDIRKLVTETVRHYLYLTKMDGDLVQIAQDAKRHRLAAKVEKMLSHVRKNAK